MGKDGRIGKNILCNIWYDKTVAPSASSVKCSSRIKSRGSARCPGGRDAPRTGSRGGGQTV